MPEVLGSPRLVKWISGPNQTRATHQDLPYVRECSPIRRWSKTPPESQRGAMKDGRPSSHHAPSNISRISSERPHRKGGFERDGAGGNTSATSDPRPRENQGEQGFVRAGATKGSLGIHRREHRLCCGAATRKHRCFMAQITQDEAKGQRWS